MKNNTIIQELKQHAPFTITAVLVALIIAILINFILGISISEEIFHSFHFAHLLVSAIVSAGLFYKYKNNKTLSVVVGFLIALAVGSLSDVIFPYLGALIFNLDVHFHLPLIEESFITIMWALLGSIIGIFFHKITHFPHFIHVFLSVFASLTYLMINITNFNINYLLLSFFIVFISVIIPCCLSDIILPISLAKNKKE